MPLIMAWTLSSSPALAEGEIKFAWPKLTYKIHAGESFSFPEDVGCYDKSALADLVVWRHVCETYNAEAQECEQVAANAVSPPKWYNSTWFYLSLGLIVGAGTATVIAVSK